MRVQMGVCLTKKQEAFFKFVQQYHRQNGTFPNASQAAKALSKDGIRVRDGSIVALYGALFIKGAFTDVGGLTDTAIERHSGGVRPFDVTKLKFTPRKITRGRKPSSATVLRKASKDSKVADAILKLLRDSEDFQRIIEGVGI